MRLREFEPDRPAADDDEMVGPVLEIEDRLIGQRLDAVDAGDRRNDRRRAGRDDEAPRRNPMTAGFEGPFVDEAALGLDNLDAEALEALDGIVRRDGIDHRAHMGVNGAEIDRRVDLLDPEGRGRAHRVCPFSRCDHRLGRHAAIVEAVAAHLAAFDQHDVDAEGGRRRGDRQPARSGPDDADVRREMLEHE